MLKNNKNMYICVYLYIYVYTHCGLVKGFVRIRAIARIGFIVLNKKGKSKRQMTNSKYLQW